jgi:hypothetical protein
VFGMLLTGLAPPGMVRAGPMLARNLIAAPVPLVLADDMGDGLAETARLSPPGSGVLNGSYFPTTRTGILPRSGVVI